MTDATTSPPDRLALLLPIIFAVGLLAAAWLVVAGPRFSQTPPKREKAFATAAAVRPPTPPPPVEPLELKAVDAMDAVAINAAVPFSTLPNPAAAPFRFAGSDEDRARSIDCLAAAMMYEAGTGDDEGQRAVAQVVLNRVRHPAYPKTVCRVVFQGSERTTGCQFTFTCDGALARVLPETAWRDARLRAAAALEGRVYAPVGYATHYHTNWVVPYWSSSLDKIAQVGTHLFFRWSGWWGGANAFRGPVGGSEIAVAKLAAFSTVHAGAAPTRMVDGETVTDYAAIPASAPRELSQQDGDTFVITLDRGASADSYASLAIKTCGERSYCKVMGWTDAAATPRSPADAEKARASMSFSFLRNREAGFEKPLWNCVQFKRRDPRQCMKTPGSAPLGEQPLRRVPGWRDNAGFTAEDAARIVPPVAQPN
ncbi:spore germination cell wall hydrolase CwlJ-like protein [Sphingomonas zeicaulis]|uniref:cell wall hydrolase n=1 Tax=Sphingomonas zeicaulis TaxID=1632740 RepID=UPI003D24CBDA